MIAAIGLRICLEDFHRDDKILFDREGDNYSVNPRWQHTDTNPTGVHLFSDKIAFMFPTYETDEHLVLQPTDLTPLLNWDYIKALLLSKDMSR